MELGISMFGDLQINPDTGAVQASQQRLQEMIEEIKLMDELGIDFMGIGEHHRPDYAVASPEIVLAAAASVTRRIKLGSAVSVISSSDPVKLYQDFATVDLLSNGRAEIMAGRGSFIESFPLFGYDLKDYSALFTEKLDLLLRINAHEKVNWTGKHRASLINQSIFPRATRQIPVWIAVGGTPESVVRAARLGLPVMFAIIGGSYAQFRPLVERYKETYMEYGHNLDAYQVGVHMHAFFGKPSAGVADWYYPFYSQQMDRIGSSRGWPPYRRAQYDYGRSLHGHLLVGDVEETVEKLLAIQETLGLTRFAAHMDVGSPDHRQMMQSIEIYGSQIIPKVRAALSQKS